MQTNNFGQIKVPFCRPHRNTVFIYYCGLQFLFSWIIFFRLWYYDVFYSFPLSPSYLFYIFSHFLLPSTFFFFSFFTFRSLFKIVNYFFISLSLSLSKSFYTFSCASFTALKIFASRSQTPFFFFFFKFLSTH